jgi:hypothetical protein
MADRYTQVVILCEDYMHFNFVRRYLIQRGIESRRIRGNVNPSGRGAGSRHVIERYPIEVKAIRSKSFLRAGLVAVIDADTSSVDDRLRQLEQSLTQSGQPSRGASERIGLLSPKRNIETWIFHLLGNAADEETDYKKRISQSDLKPSVAAFADMCPNKAEEISVPSLRHARGELTGFLDRGK